MIKIIVRSIGDNTYIGDYHAPVIPSINDVISTPFTNYKVIEVHHDISNKLSVDTQFEGVTVYVGVSA